MRIFVSHNINTSQNRPVEYRDSEDDVAALESLGKLLSEAGFRVFEYQFQRTETETKDILFMMARQIALADAVVFVATRDAYVTPGWSVPELFHALAHQKEIFCCRLRDSRFDGESFGDASNPCRFRILLPASSPLHTPDSLLEHLRRWRDRMALKKSPNLFDHVDSFLAWRMDQPTVAGSIELLLETYEMAWGSGFRPARIILSGTVKAPYGTSLSKISGWIDDDHVGMVWKGKGAKAWLTLVNTNTGLEISTALPADVEPLGLGTSEGGELVLFSHQAAGGLLFRRWRQDRWELFSSAATPAIFTGVIRDRWFSGSDLIRLDWKNQKFVPETPTVEDWALFRRFTWFEPPQENSRPLGAASFQPILFATQPERWTLLPAPWRSLQGDVDCNASRLIVWDKCRILFGDLATATSFGSPLPAIRMTGTSAPSPTGNRRAPGYLVALCEENSLSVPNVSPYRIETEKELSLSWTASHNKRQTHFIWSLSLAEARQFLEKKLLSIPA